LYSGWYGSNTGRNCGSLASISNSQVDPERGVLAINTASDGDTPRRCRLA
jgi:hypothetical protein